MVPTTPAEASEIFRTPPHRMLEVDRAQVAYRTVGRGPDVVFVHGWPASGATFRGLLPLLAPHVTCHLLDLPGAGHSRFDRSAPISLAGHIAAVRRVVDLLALRDVAVVGHDSGGLIARHALAGDPRVRGWGLVNTEQPQGVNWRFGQFLAMAKLPGFADVLAWAAMQRGLRRNPLLLGDCFADTSLLDGEFEEFFLAPLRDDPERRWAAGQFGRAFDVARIHELRDVHARMTAPVQLVWGEGDPFFPLVRTEEMVHTFPDARLHVVRGAKLFVHEEKPEEVAAALLPVLTGAGRASRAAE